MRRYLPGLESIGLDLACTGDVPNVQHDYRYSFSEYGANRSEPNKHKPNTLLSCTKPGPGGTFYSGIGRFTTGKAPDRVVPAYVTRLCLIVISLTHVKAGLRVWSNIVNGHSHRPEMTNDKQNTQVRQGQIVRAALRVIAREGTASLSVARIAQEIGLVPSAIYRHFKGKDEIIDAVLKRIRELLLANVAAVKRQAGNPLEAMRLLMIRHLKLFCENDGISTLIFSDQVYSGPAKRKKAIFVVIQDYRLAVAGLVREGQGKGWIKASLDPDAVAVMFLGLVQPPGILWHLSEGRFDVRKQATNGWEIFEQLLGEPDFFVNDVNRHSLGSRTNHQHGSRRKVNR